MRTERLSKIVLGVAISGGMVLMSTGVHAGEDDQDSKKDDKALTGASGTQPQPLQFTINRWFNASGSIFLNIDSDNDDADTQSLNIMKNSNTDTGGEMLVRVQEDGKVGIGTIPAHQFHLVGDMRVEGRLAIGNDAYFGLGQGPYPTFDRLYDFSHVMTDFSSSTEWSPILSVFTLDPTQDLTSHQIYANSFEAHTAASSAHDMAFVDGLAGGALHRGTGTVSNLFGGYFFSGPDGPGLVRRNFGILAIASAGSDGGSITDNMGVTVSTGHFGSVGNIENNYGLLVQSPLASQPIDVNYGIFLEDQNVAQTTNYAIYSEGGASYFAGSIGVGRLPAANKLEVEGNASKSAAGDWLANSDRRIKKDVVSLSGALEVVNKVRPVAFRYTDQYRQQHPSIDDRLYYNVIAQEFAEVFPDAVHESGEYLEEGEAILQVDTHPAVMHSIAAIQELHELVRERDSRIAALEERIAKLEALIRQDR